MSARILLSRGQLGAVFHAFATDEGHGLIVLGSLFLRGLGFLLLFAGFVVLAVFLGLLGIFGSAGTVGRGRPLLARHSGISGIFLERTIINLLI